MKTRSHIVVAVAVLTCVVACTPLQAVTLKDRVKEISTSTGTGTITLGGTVSGFVGFSAVGDGNTAYYTIVHRAQNEWEVGLGTYTAAGTTLSRTTVYASSNAGSLVAFSAGTKDVFVSIPASKVIYADESGNVGIGVTADTALLKVENLTLDTTVSYEGLDLHLTKTAGTTTEADNFIGLRMVLDMNHNGSTVGHVWGSYSQAILTDGTIGDGQEDLQGSRNVAQLTAGTAGDDVMGVFANVDGNGGTVTGDIDGISIFVDLESTMTSIGGDVRGLYVLVDADENPTGTAYMIYMDELTGIDFGLFQNGTADNHFGGALSIGADTTPDSQLEVVSTSVQLRLTHTDGVDDATFGVDSDGNLTITPSGGEVAFVANLKLTGNDTPGALLNLKSAAGVANTLIMDTTDVVGDSSDVNLEFHEAGTRRWRIFNNGGSGDQLQIIDDQGTNNFVLTILQGGSIGFRDTSPDSPLEVLSTTDPQLRLSHTDVVDDATFGVDASGDLTILASGGDIDFGNETLTTTGGGSLTGTWTDLGSVTTVDINGGTLDAVVIGGASAAAATVTTLATGGDITLADGNDIITNATTGTVIATATSQKLAFWAATPVDQPDALTAQDTSITHTAPGTPDFALQDLVDSGVGSAFGFATKDEGNTVLQVILNLQTRVAELEARIEELGLVASN